MKLYIMRHGETAWNVEGRLQGQSDTELNENGVRLAKVTAEGSYHHHQFGGMYGLSSAS